MFADKKKKIENALPINDPKYIAFKNLKGILGHIDADKLREDRTNEVITRYKCRS